MSVRQTEICDIEYINSPLEHLEQPRFQVSQLLRISGNSHRYQKNVLTILGIMQFFCSIVYVCIPLLFYNPKMYCINEDLSYRVCPEVEACKNPYGYIMGTQRFSLVSKFQLVCERKHLDLYGKNVIFITAALAILLISSISDYLGRKFMFLVSGLCMIIGTILGLTNHYNSIIIGVAFCFSSMGITNNFTSVYTNEVVGSGLRSRAVPMILAFGGIGLFFSTILSLVCKTYKQNIILPGLCNGTLIIMYFYFVETPFYLAKNNNANGLLKSLTKINRINYQDDDRIRSDNQEKIEGHILHGHEIIEKEQMLQNEGLNVSQPKDVEINSDTNMSFKMVFFIVSCLSCIVLNNAIITSLFTIAAQRIGNKNFQLNGILAVVLSASFVIYIIKQAPYIGRRFMYTLQTICVMLTCVLLYILKVSGIIHQPSGMFLDIFLSLIIITITNVANCLMPAYISELLPTKYRGRVAGMEMFLGKMSYIVSSYLDYVGFLYDMNPMILCIVPALFSFIGARLLHETNCKK